MAINSAAAAADASAAAENIIWERENHACRSRCNINDARYRMQMMAMTSIILQISS